MIKDYNYDEFGRTSKSQWIEKLTADLGEDTANRMSSWMCERNLSMSAYYDQDDLSKKLPFLDKTSSSWSYLQPIKSDTSNAHVIDALMNGADGLMLNGDSVKNIDKILDQVSPEHCTIAVKSFDIKNYRILIDWCAAKLQANQTANVLLFHETEEISMLGDAHQDFVAAALKLGNNAGNKTLHLNGDTIQQKGGSAQLEIAYLLSQATYYMNHFQDLGHDLRTICDSLFISTAIGSNFFLELSKIRVIRMLFGQLTKAYGIENHKMPIHASTSVLTQSVLDSNTNFLRCTSGAMSAVLGGVDYLTIEPNHDLKFADRIARNISNLLKEESYLSKTVDPSSGSYYIEGLSNELASKAWRIFQDLEKNGGFVNAVRQDYFEEEAQKDLQFQKSRIASGRRKMVGVNDFGNPDERIQVEQLKHENTSLSKDFEQVRMMTEQHVAVHGEDHRPVVYLLAVGSDAKMTNARFTFATNFFNWSGMTVKKLGQQDQLAKLSVIVCCGADDDYTDQRIAEAFSQINSSILVLAAGKENEAASNNITGWINIKTNRLTFVQHVLHQLGLNDKTSQS